ncbi:hypothetical protein [Lignipirellula cremea]|uniref:Uncharacterized protein n=1 Tax=Lignipirellula cremea TaxID=2528010 RepID=A0A518DW79_9BACT|nr:hypothetical protein [Lignipirellula cremea]QDU96083.1 hypothetical protein Pla8534_39020 [Lignipirellula cremea]
MLGELLDHSDIMVRQAAIYALLTCPEQAWMYLEEIAKGLARSRVTGTCTTVAPTATATAKLAMLTFGADGYFFPPS